MAALLTSVLGDGGKVAAYIDECNRQGIKVLPPNVNESEMGFTVSGNSIRFGLRAIKSIGKGLIDVILAQRQKGRFVSYYDFCSRVYGKELNRRALENLIKAGALDGMGAGRRQMMVTLPMYMDQIAAEKKNIIEGQLNLFGDENFREAEPALPQLPASWPILPES